MLPQGMSLAQATAGFSNQREFMAALNASASQGVSFADLKNAMLGNGFSVGQAVREVRNSSASANAH